MNYPKYYLNDDNFPFKVIIYDPKNPKHRRNGLSDDNKELTILRYWKGKEVKSYSIFNTAEATKKEFDLWVEYWKIEAAKETRDAKLQSKKEAELKKIEAAICVYRQKNN